MKKALILMTLFILLAAVGCNVPSKKVSVHFYKDGNLSSVNRLIPTLEDPLMIAITELMKGPNPTEQMEGYTTGIPAGTQARRIEREGNVAILELNSKLATLRGGTPEAEGVLAQIVYTATSVRGIKYVLLKLQGADHFELGRSGYIVDHPLERRDIKR
ncbi:GerMN domain-containing protein [Candidatus Margulisiibacteriota bacterium]